MKFNFIAKTYEIYASNTIGSSRFIDSFSFIRENVDELVKILKEHDCLLTRKVSGHWWDLPQQKMVYLKKRSRNSDFDKPLTNHLEKEKKYSTLTMKAQVQKN